MIWSRIIVLIFSLVTIFVSKGESASILKHANVFGVSASVRVRYDETSWSEPMHTLITVHTPHKVEYIMTAFYTEMAAPDYWHYVFVANGALEDFPIFEQQSTNLVSTPYLEIEEILETYATYDSTGSAGASTYNVIQNSFDMSAGIPFDIDLNLYMNSPVSSDRQTWDMIAHISGRFEDKRYGLAFVAPEPNTMCVVTCLLLCAWRRRSATD